MYHLFFFYLNQTECKHKCSYIQKRSQYNALFQSWCMGRVHVVLEWCVAWLCLPCRPCVWAEEMLTIPKIRVLAPSMERGLDLSDVGR